MRVTRHVVDARARVFARDLKAGTVAIMPPAVWEADNPLKDRVRHFDGHEDGAHLRSEPCEITGGETARRGVRGVDKKRAAGRPIRCLKRAIEGARLGPQPEPRP